MSQILRQTVAAEFPTLPKYVRDAAVDLWAKDPDFFRDYDKKKNKNKTISRQKELLIDDPRSFEVLDDFPEELKSKLEVYYSKNNAASESQ